LWGISGGQAQGVENINVFHLSQIDLSDRQRSTFKWVFCVSHLIYIAYKIALFKPMRYVMCIYIFLRCSTTVESFPSAPNYSSNQEIQPELQKMRVLVGAPQRTPPKHQTVLDSLMPVFTSVDSMTASSSAPVDNDKSVRPESLNNLLIFCTSDFTTVSKEVHLRTRRVRLVGLEVYTNFSLGSKCVISFTIHLLTFMSLLLCRDLVKLLF